MKESPVGIIVIVLEIIRPVDGGGIKWNPLSMYINREAISVGEVGVEYLDKSDSLWWVRTELEPPPISLDPIGEIGIGVIKTLLMH